MELPAHLAVPRSTCRPDTDPYDPAVYAKGRENFQRQIREGVLVRDPRTLLLPLPADHGHAHPDRPGGDRASVADYDSNRIRKHEFTRPDKEDDRVRQIDALNAQTGPVFLTYRRSTVIDALAAAVPASAPDVDVTADDGVRHTLWAMRDAGEHRCASPRAFDAMPTALHRRRPSSLGRGLAGGGGAPCGQSGPHRRGVLQLLPGGDLSRTTRCRSSTTTGW
ncbi:MAG: DUF1015 domain-containing protein [Comamonadaceae bacterium]|nr:DUF1015 domain-containing protein [Comamonadaceae bacterium]